jgi:hypothetical protein
MSKKFTHCIAAAGFLAGLAVTMTFAVDTAEAQYGYRIQPHEWHYETKRPQRGYEGFPAPGIYCSYRREPNRVCSYDKRGRERCRIKSWRLVQFCS